MANAMNTGTTAGAPPPGPGPTTAKKPFPVWTVAIALIALIVGGAVGYVAGMPQRNDLQSQRDSLQLERDEQQAARAKAEETITQLEKDVETANSATSGVAKGREICSKAASDGSDLITQYINFVDDLDALYSEAAVGVYDADLVGHMQTQAETMDAQSIVVEKELDDCNSAVNE